MQIYIKYNTVVDFCNLKLSLEYTLNRKKKKRFVELSGCWLTDRHIPVKSHAFSLSVTLQGIKSRTHDHSHYSHTDTKSMNWKI